MQEYQHPNLQSNSPRSPHRTPPEGGGVTALLSGFMGAKLPEGEARVFRGLCPHRLGRALPKAEAKLLVDKKELFIKLRLMKRGLGARCPTAGEARVFRGLCPHQALLSGFMGAKLPKGQSQPRRGRRRKGKKYIIS